MGGWKGKSTISSLGLRNIRRAILCCSELNGGPQKDMSMF